MVGKLIGKLISDATRNRRRRADDEDTLGDVALGNTEENARTLRRISDDKDSLEGLASKDSLGVDNAQKQAVMLALLEAMEEGGRTMSDADSQNVSEMEARAIKSGNNEARRRNVTMPRPKQRPSGMMMGGKVKKYKGGGAVMAGRGGSFKGAS